MTKKESALYHFLAREVGGLSHDWKRVAGRPGEDGSMIYEVENAGIGIGVTVAENKDGTFRLCDDDAPRR